MKTKYITLRFNKALNELSEYAKKSKNELSDKIIKSLLELDNTYDTPEVCGEMLPYGLHENAWSVQQFSVYCFGVSSPRIVSILRGIQVWGIHDDCKECGCEMTYNDISEHKECKNDFCGCSINTDNSPDPDQYRDDCHRELTTNFNLN